MNIETHTYVIGHYSKLRDKNCNCTKDSTNINGHDISHFYKVSEYKIGHSFNIEESIGLEDKSIFTSDIKFAHIFNTYYEADRVAKILSLAYNVQDVKPFRVFEIGLISKKPYNFEYYPSIIKCYII